MLKIIILLLVLILGTPAFSASDTQYTELNTMLVTPGECVTSSDTYCTLAPITSGKNVFVPEGIIFNSGDFEYYLDGLFRLGVALAGALAVIMIVVGGVQYITSEAGGGKDEGKNRINAALLGLVVILGSYALLNTISPTLLSTKLTLENVSVKPLEIITPTDEAPVYGPDGQPVDVGGYVPPTNIPAGKSEEELRKFFADNGIPINNPPCTEGQTTGCTNVQGLGDGAISGIPALKTATGGPITITGGTEGGHITHGVGKSIVDLRKTSTLDNYIIQNKTSTESTSVGPRYTLPNGSVYLDEGDHWHVVFPG